MGKLNLMLLPLRTRKADIYCYLNWKNYKYRETNPEKSKQLTQNIEVKEIKSNIFTESNIEKSHIYIELLETKLDGIKNYLKF